MYRSILALCAALLLPACATFSPTQQSYITPALEMQQSVVADPQFREIMLELDGVGAINWDERLSENAQAEAAAMGSRVEWLLAKYAQAPGLPPANVRAWRKWNPFSSTTAVYNANANIVKLNLWRFNKNEFALLNTFFHEHAHSFGLVHDKSTQRRPPNMCDPTYVSGDLAEAIMRTNAGNTGTSPHKPVCPALCLALETRSMWSNCQ